MCYQQGLVSTLIHILILLKTEKKYIICIGLGSVRQYQVEANVDTFDGLVRKLLFRFMNRCHRSTNVFVHSLLHSCRFRCSKYAARFIDLLSVNGLGEAYCCSLAL